MDWQEKKEEKTVWGVWQKLNKVIIILIHLNDSAQRATRLVNWIRGFIDGFNLNVGHCKNETAETVVEVTYYTYVNKGYNYLIHQLPIHISIKL